MDVHIRQTGEIVGDPVRDQMHLLTADGEVARLRVIGAIHAAQRREIPRRHQPLAHAPSTSCERATPCRAPARNQYWMPICVTNGVKLKISTAVPRLALSTAAAHAFSRGLCFIIA